MPKRLLNGIEAIALSAVEGGADFITSSADASCVGVSQEAMRQKARARLSGVRAELATSGTSAAEAAIMAAADGARAVWACSHAELYANTPNVILKRSMKMRGALVIVACADADSLAAQPTSDIRRFAQFAKMPLFDPSDPKQAMSMMKAALELSSEYEIPVLVNVVGLIAATSMFYDMDAATPTPAPIRSKYNDVYLKSASLDEKIRKIGHAFSYDQNLIGFNRIYDRRSSDAQAVPGQAASEQVSLGIACAGASVTFAAQALQAITDVAKANNLPLPAYRVLQVCTPYPYPKRAMYRFVNGLTDILVVEGPDAVIENGMLKDSANNFLAPKIASIPAPADTSGLRALTLGIAGFLDACAGQMQQPSAYNPGRLVPFVEDALKESATYSCSIPMPARQPSRFDDEAFVAAFDGFVRAAAKLRIPPERIAISGMPRHSAVQVAPAACARFRQAPLPVELAPLQSRIAWARSAARRRDVRAVVLATLREVLAEGVGAIMEARLQRFDVAVIVVDPAGAGESLGVDVVALLSSLKVGIAICEDPGNPELVQRACADAMSMSGASFALLVGGLSDRGGSLLQGSVAPSSCLRLESGVAGEHAASGGVVGTDAGAAAGVDAGAVRAGGADFVGAVGAAGSAAGASAADVADASSAGGAQRSAKDAKPAPKKEPRVYLDDVVHEDMNVNGADSSVPKSVTVGVTDEDGDELPVSIQNIVQSFDLGSISLSDDGASAPDSPYLTIASLESGPVPSRRSSRSKAAALPKPRSAASGKRQASGRGATHSRNAGSAAKRKPKAASASAQGGPSRRQAQRQGGKAGASHKARPASAQGRGGVDGMRTEGRLR